MAIPLTFLITDLHRGGSPLMLAALARGLKARGKFEPEVVSIAPMGEVGELLEKGGVKAKSLRAAGVTDYRVARRFLGYVRRRRPAVVCSILVHANLLATLVRPMWEAGPELGGRRRRRAVWVQSIHTVQEKPQWHWFVQGIIAGRCDAMIAPSSAVLRKIEGYGPISRGIVIPNGIDVRRFREADAVSWEERRWPEGSWVVGYMGRLDPVKRVGLILRAARRLVDKDVEMRRRLQVALVGYGREEWPLRELAGELGLLQRVHFIGVTPVPEKWYKCFDVLCLPSSAEGFGLVLVEAAAAGIPAIACRTEAIRETVGDDGATWVSADPSATELAAAIRKVLAVREFRAKSVSELGRYSEVRMVEGYERAFESLLKSCT